MTTNSYIGISRPTNRMIDSAITVGAASTAALEVELRVSTTTSGGHFLTTYDVLCALDQFRRFIMKQGVGSLGVGMPAAAPNPTDPAGP